MKKVNINRKKVRDARHKRITNKWKKNENKLPRLLVTRSNMHIACQIIDDQKGVTIASSSSKNLKLENGNVKNAALVGADIAKKAKAKKVESVCFDRAGNKFHGRVKALAEAARENGLKF